MATVTIAGVCYDSAFAASLYSQTNLASDIPGKAANPDANLKNPWGMSFGNSTPFWVSNQVTNNSTLYNAAGAPQPLVVTTPAGPTGQVFNGTPGFELTPGNPARFIFASMSGAISGWNPSVNATSAVTQFLATDGAAYTGLTMANNGSANLLYAADNANGKIDVFDANFSKISLSGSFTDPNLPSGFAPYNIQNISGKLYVTYAQEDAPGGFIGVFDVNGNLLQHISDSHLDSPWGLTMAPGGFGDLANALLVGNEGNGMINGYDAVTFDFIGTVSGVGGPIANPGLWALAFRSPTSGFNPDALYFTAGLNDETNGLFGEITLAGVPEPGTFGTAAMALGLALGIRRLTRRAPHRAA